MPDRSIIYLRAVARKKCDGDTIMILQYPVLAKKITIFFLTISRLSSLMTGLVESYGSIIRISLCKRKENATNQIYFRLYNLNKN